MVYANHKNIFITKIFRSMVWPIILCCSSNQTLRKWCNVVLLQVHKQSELADNVSLKQFLEGIILGRVEAVGEETVTRAVVREERRREGGKEGEREESVAPSYKCISYFPPASTSRSSLCQTLGFPRPSPFFLLPLQPLWLETQVAGHCDTIWRWATQLATHTWASTTLSLISANIRLQV